MEEKMELKIDVEFKKLIPKLTDDEFNQLEKNILDDGIRDKIIIWQDTIIDGHNRYKLAQKHNLDFETDEMDFDDRNDVKIWIIKNQFGRRNISNYDRSRLVLELEPLISAKAKEKQRDAGGAVHQKSDKAVIDTKKELAAVAGVSHDTIAKVKKIEQKATPEIKRKLSIGDLSINEAYQDIKKEEKKEQLEKKKDEYKEKIISLKDNTSEYKIDIFNTDKKFRIIYADPPWEYADKQDNPNLGGASKHYNSMSIDELCALPISKISNKDSVLFLWITSPKLNLFLELMTAWGFEYKTSFVWDKIKHNMGHYNSVRHEFLLIGGKGKSAPDIKKLYDSVISIERSDNHSEKPVEFMDMIDELYVHGDRIELFCRKSKKENWYVWGNEI
jgi:N6-adenosine-specific RNA methylase IME4